MSSSNQTARVPFGLRLFFGIFIVVGLIVFGVGVCNLARSLSSESWPSVSGVVISSEMRQQTDNHGSTTYSANIAYNYQVGSSHYSATRLAFGAVSSSSAAAQEVLGRYPMGGAVRVYYSPADPQEAVLEPGIHGGTRICFTIGVVFVLTGVGFWRLLAVASRMSQSPIDIATRPISIQQAPVFMAAIFIIMGSVVCFGNPSGDVPKWIVCAAGVIFILSGLFMLAKRLPNQLYANILGIAALATFLTLFHWVSFAPGVNVKTPFAVFTVLMDLALLGVLVLKLKKWRKP